MPAAVNALPCLPSFDIIFHLNIYFTEKIKTPPSFTSSLQLPERCCPHEALGPSDELQL